MATDLNDSAREFFAKRGHPSPENPRGGASQIPGLTLADEAAAFNERRMKARAAGTSLEAKARPPETPLSDFKGQTLQFATPWKTYDTGFELNPGTAKSLAQSGSGFQDMILGAKQLAGRAGTKEQSEALADEKRKLDDPLNRGVMGTINNMIPKVMVGSLAPQSVLGSPVATGIGMGAAQGAIEPVATGESRMGNIAIGGAAGAFVPQAVKSANKIAQTSDPIMGPLAQEAARRGFPMGLADTAEPGFATSFRNVGRYVPLFKQQIEKWDAKRQELFNRQIGDVIGLDGKPLTSTNVTARHDELKKAVEDTWKSQPLIVTRTMSQQLDALRAKADKFAPNVAAAIHSRIDSLEGRMTNRAGVDPVSGLPFTQRSIDGEVAHNLQDGWRLESRNTKDVDQHQVQPLLQELRGIVTGTFESQLPQAQREALTTANTQLGAAKAIIPSTVKSETGQAQRTIDEMTPNDLSQSIAKYYGKDSKDSPYGQLGNIGQQIIKDTSTRNRSLLANTGPVVGSLTGGAGAGALVGNTMGAISDPGVFNIGASLAAGLAGAGGIGGGIGSLMASPGFRKLMTEEPKTFGEDMARRMGKSAMVQGPLALQERYDTSRQLGTEKEPEPPRVDIRGTRENMTPEEAEFYRKILGEPTQ
jgi:hypothetical protein